MHKGVQLSLWFTAALALAQGTRAQSVTGSVNATTIGTGESVAYTLEIAGTDVPEPDDISAPDASGLTLRSPFPSRSTSVSIVNGLVSRSIKYTWSYAPQQEGPARIEGMQVQIGSQTHEVAPVDITVVPQGQRPQRPRSRSLFDALSPFDAEPEQSVADQDVFIRALPGAREAFQNEQVLIEYRMYVRADLQTPRNSRQADSWDAEGFWRVELDPPSAGAPQVVVEDGMQYRVHPLKRVAVFPIRPGELVVDPFRIETEVMARPRSLFSNPFLGLQYEPVARASEAVNITAKPLPGNPPEGFTGAVGRFSVDASISDHDVEVGDAIQLEFRLEGEGNVALVEPPELDLPGIFERYDPDVQTSVSTSGRQVSGSKLFTWLLVPRSNGTFALPQLRYAWFDPQAEQYESVALELGTVRVSGTASAPVTVTSSTGMPVDDIQPIMRNPTWVPLKQTPLHQQFWFYVLIFAPMLAYGLTTVARRRAVRLATDTAFVRHRTAHPLARKHLKQARHQLRTGDTSVFYEALERAVLGFVGNRLNVAERGMTWVQLDAALESAGIGAELRARVTAFLESCDEARFGPRDPDHAAMRQHLDLASRLLSRIAHELESR